MLHEMPSRRARFHPRSDPRSAATGELSRRDDQTNVDARTNLGNNSPVRLRVSRVTLMSGKYIACIRTISRTNDWYELGLAWQSIYT